MAKKSELKARLTLDKAQFDRGIRAATDQAKAFGKAVKTAAGAAGKAAFLGLAVGATAAAVAMRKAVSAAAEMEALETGFAVLLGGMEKAQARMKELAKFADTTPFDLPEVAMASRALEVMTKGALSTGDGLRLIGDVAAGTQTQFSELAVTVGRLFDALSSGRPAGEPLMRLQEIGAIGGDVRAKIESMQKAGKDFSEIWKVAASGFGRFSGMMDKQSATWNGRMSTLKDAADGVFREIGRPIIDVLNPQLKLAAEELERMKPLAASVGQALATAASGGLSRLLPLLRNALANIQVQVQLIIADFQNGVHEFSQAWKKLQSMITGAKFEPEKQPHSPEKIARLREQAISLDHEFTRLAKDFAKSILGGLSEIKPEFAPGGSQATPSAPPTSAPGHETGIASSTGGLDYLKSPLRPTFTDQLKQSRGPGIEWNPKTGGFDRTEAIPGLKTATMPTSRQITGIGPLATGIDSASASATVRSDPFALSGGIGYGTAGATPGKPGKGIVGLPAWAAGEAGRKIGGKATAGGQNFGMFGYGARKAAEREQKNQKNSGNHLQKLDRLEAIDANLQRLVGD